MSERSPREHYAARLVRSGHAHWHGLADQDADAWAAEQGFAHLGEVLPQMQASYLRLRGQLIAGEQRPAFLLDEARAGPLATLADRGALDTARIGRVLERIARRVIALARGADVDDEDGLEEQLWALRAGGNLLAWATLEALAAAVLDDGGTVIAGGRQRHHSLQLQGISFPERGVQHPGIFGSITGSG